MKKILLILLIFFSLILFSCGTKEDKEIEFNIHSDLQQEALKGPYFQMNSFADGRSEQSYPNTFDIKWNKTVGPYSIYLSTDESFNNSVIYQTEECRYSFINMMINQVYYYKVIDSLDSEILNSNFKTLSNGPRNLFISGITNARDLGGWETDTGRIKQNMIIRTSKLTADETGSTLIFPDGISYLNNVVGIKTELDLRRTDNGEAIITDKSVLGDNVNYIQFPMESSGNILVLNKDKLKDLFAILGNEENYPICFHCSIGTDRTGFVAFLIEALMGVSEENLYQDYLFSNFGKIGGTRSFTTIKNYLNTICTSSRLSIKEQTYNYLISVGVNKTDIDNMINILSE